MPDLALTLSDIESMSEEECRAALRALVSGVQEAADKLLDTHQERHKRLVELYLANPGMPEEEAYRQAGFGGPNATRHSLRQGFYEAMKRPDVVEYRKQLTDALAGMNGARQQRALDQTWVNWQVDPLDCFDEEGRFRPLSEIPEQTRRSIEAIEVKQFQDKDVGPGEVIKIKFFKAASQTNFHKAVGLAVTRLADKDGENLKMPTLVFMPPQAQGPDDGTVIEGEARTVEDPDAAHSLPPV